jgi:hypothetical protein
MYRPNPHPVTFVRPFVCFAGNRLFADVSRIYDQVHDGFCPSIRCLGSLKPVPLCNILFLSRGCGDVREAINLAIKFCVPVVFVGATQCMPALPPGFVWVKKPGGFGLPFIPCFRAEPQLVLF